MTLIKLNAIKYKGISLMSLLVALTLFSGIFLAMTKWTSFQREKYAKIYHSLQGAQIAEGQKQRMVFGLPCQTKIKQNHIEFQVRCTSNRVIVRSSMSQITF